MLMVLSKGCKKVKSASQKRKQCVLRFFCGKINKSKQKTIRNSCLEKGTRV